MAESMPGRKADGRVGTNTRRDDMNKGITLLILLVVLGAMGLVMFLHGPSAPPVSTADSSAASGPAQQGGFASPLQAPQGGVGGLRPIDPPIGVDGAPKPVTLAAGSDARALRPVVPPHPDEPAPPQERMPEPSAPAEPAQQPAVQASSPNGASGRGGSPGLTAGSTPWASSQQGKAERKNGTSAARPSGAAATAPSAVATASPPAVVPAPNPHQPEVLDPVAKGAPPSNTGAHSLRSINLGFSGQQMLLRIEAGDAFPVKTFALTGPDRLVVDLPGSWKGMKAPAVPDNNVVSKVRLGDQPSGPRLVLDLKGPLKNHTVERSGNRVDILVK